MRKLPILTAVLLLGGVSAVQGVFAWTADDAADSAGNAATQTDEAQPETTTNPQALQLVREARSRLVESRSVEAEMTQVVALGQYRFRAAGSYLSGSGLSAAGFRYRLEYRVELGDLEGQFLEVCDGQIVRTRRQIGRADRSLLSTEAPELDLTRRDIQKIIREARQNRDVADAVLAAEIGIGGLPAVLASLERSMVFDAQRRESINGQDYIVVQGRWRAERKDEIFAVMGPLTGQISGFVPDLVRVYFVADSLFPAKFLYLKSASEERQTYHPMVTIEFHNIRIGDEPPPPDRFVYAAPPGVEEKDETNRFLQMIEQAAQRQE